MIPISPLVDSVAKALDVDPLALAIGDSVDFRVLFSAAEQHKAQLQAGFHTHGWELFEIGYLAESRGKPDAYLQGKHGELLPLPGVEWAQADVLSVDVLRSHMKKRDTE